MVKLAGADGRRARSAVEEGLFGYADREMTKADTTRVRRTVRPARAALASTGRYADYSDLFAVKDDFKTLSPDVYDAQYAKLNDIGYMRVAEFISSGMLPWEYAHRNGFSLMVFRDWWDACPAEVALRAKVNHAEACVVKSELVLMSPPLSKEEAAVQVELAKSLRWRSERLNGPTWNPAKPKDAAPRAISIRLAASIPGMDHIWGANARVIEHDPNGRRDR